VRITQSLLLILLKTNEKMLSQNNQGNVQQCLFTGAMAKPVMNVNNTMSRQNTSQRVSAAKPTMAV